MRTTSSDPADASGARANPRRRGLRGPLLWLLAAFAVGLLLSLVVLMRDRDADEGFFRAGPDAPAARSREYAPLPAPLPAGEADTVGMRRPPADPAGEEARPEIIERRPPPPPPPTPVRREPPRVANVRPEPIPGQTPSPRYPASALRRGEEGTVIVRAEIGPDGVPTSTSLARGSGSRDLDRAAVDAVRRWRFRPATVDGRPTVDTVLVPIEFSRE